jgi:glycine cleavage system H lipoate-binding protein
VNEDPYGKGWFVKVKIEGGLSPDLLGSDAYQELVASESH